MNCVTSALLQQFLANSLSAEDDLRVGLHLAECLDCRQLADSICHDPEIRKAFANREDGESPLDSLHTKLASILPRTDLPHPADFLAGSQDDISESEMRAKEWIERELAAAETTALNQPSSDRQREEVPLIHDRLQMVGRFQLQRRLGLGGFGVVYLAYDTILKRQVALKLPRSIALVDPDLRRRFLREGEAVASLHHQNIVPVFEAGEVHGLCFIATAYIPGPSLAKWLAKRKKGGGLSNSQAVEIVLALAEATHHAHSAGILHRDIKPGNVLLDPTHRTGHLPFMPKLADFGLAKTIDHEAHGTTTGTMLGTPQYMAPEQASGRREKVGPATDVYSLGVLLYELLTGRLPIVGADNTDTLRRLLVDEPPSVRSLARQVPEDLEAVCMRCLEKSPEDRYPSAEALADDLRSVRDGTPTSTRPDNFVQSCRRWKRRHPAQARYLAAMTTLALLMMVGMWFHLTRLQGLNRALEKSLHLSQAARNDALISEYRLQQGLYAADMRVAAQAQREGDYRQLDLLLARHVGRVGMDFRGFEWCYLNGFSRNRYEPMAQGYGAAYFVRFSEDGRWLASAGEDGFVRIYEVSSGNPVVEFDALHGEVNSVAFSADGKRVVTAGDDGHVAVWDWRGGGVQIVRRPICHSRAFVALFFDDDRQIVCCSEEPWICVLDAQTCAITDRRETGEFGIESLAIDSQGHRVAAAGTDSTITIWNLDTLDSEAHLRAHTSKVMGVAFSPDGRHLASGALDGQVLIWDTDTSEVVVERKHFDGIQSVAFCADGQLLAAGDRGGVIYWQSAVTNDSEVQMTTDQPDRWNGHQGRIYSLAFDPNSRRLVSAGQDGEVRAWSETQLGMRQLLNRDQQSPVHDIAFTPDSNSLLSVDQLGVRKWNLSDSTFVQLDATKREEPVLLSTREDWFAVGDVSGRVMRLAYEDGHVHSSWETDRTIDIQRMLQVDDDSIALVGWDADEQIALYDVDGKSKGSVRTLPHCRTAASCREDRWLAFDRLDDVIVWDLETDREAQRLVGHNSTVRTIAFSLSGEWIASGSEDREIRIWDVSSGETVHTLLGCREPIDQITFTPDGNTLISADRSGAVRLWHVATGQHLFVLDESDDPVSRLRVSPDGRRVAYLAESRIVVFSIPDKNDDT